MSKEEIKKWLESTKEAGYIDCDNKFEGIDDEEFNFIVAMTEELLQRMEKDEK